MPYTPDVVRDDGCMKQRLYKPWFLWVERERDHRMDALDQVQKTLEWKDRPAMQIVVNTSNNGHETNTNHKGLRKLLSSYKGMEPCLLGRPARHRIQVQKALAKVDERSTVIEFCSQLSEKSHQKKNQDLPLSISWLDRDVFEAGIGAWLIISGNEFALKYCFPGCSFVLCSREYCSILLRRYFFSFWWRCGFQTSKESKN